MNEVELFEKMHKEVIALMEELEVVTNERNELNRRIQQMYEAIHDQQIEGARYNWKNQEDVRNPLIPADTLFKIFKLNAGTCEKALQIMEERSRKENNNG